MHNWAQTPTEVLLNIFQQVDSSAKDDYQQSKHTLNSCQTVCKNWRKAAQKVFYQTIHLGEQHTVGFVDAVSKDGGHELGTLVRTLVFTRGFLQVDKYMDKLQTIIYSCPNVEELYATEHTKSAIWPCLLLDTKGRFERVLSIENDEMWPNDVESSTYPFLALALRKTLSNVHMILRANSTIAESYSQYIYDYLASHINEFTALKQISFVKGVFTSLADLDNTIDLYCNKVQSLRFGMLLVSSDAAATKLEQSHNVNQIRINSCMLSTALIQYLCTKFQSLRNLTIDFMQCPYDTRADAWWQGFTTLCLPLAMLKIRINFSLISTDYQLLQTADFCTKLGSKDNELVIELNVEDTRVTDYYNLNINDPPWGIEMYKKEERIKVSVLLSSEDSFGEYLDSILDGFELSDLKAITVNDIAPIKNIYCKYRREESSKTQIKNLLTEDEYFCSWELFYKVTYKYKGVSEMKFNQLILLDISTEHEELNIVALPVQGRLNRLTLASSVIQEVSFKDISTAFQEIHTMILDNCCVLTEDRSKVVIDLPKTSIDHFIFKVSSTFADAVEATESLAYEESVQTMFEKYSLENPVLYDALVLPDGKYTLKVETESKTYIYSKSGKSIVAVEEEEREEGLLLSVRCRSLQKISIIGIQDSHELLLK